MDLEYFFPDDSKKQVFTKSTGKPLITLRFTEVQTGRKVLVRACYSNKKGERGPYSGWLKAFVI